MVKRLKTIKHKNNYLLILLLVCATTKAYTQPIEWLSFEQLEDSLKVKPKPVLIDFYTSWCTYCRKMDRVVFTSPDIEEIMHEEYYAVKMDAETTDTIVFDGQAFINNRASKKRKGIHDLAILLGQRNGQFVPPTILILNNEFRITAMYFEYLDSKRLRDILDKNRKE